MLVTNTSIPQRLSCFPKSDFSSGFSKCLRAREYVWIPGNNSIYYIIHYTYICMGSCFFFGGGSFFFWSPGPLIACCPGHVVPVISSPYCLVPGALVSWSSRPLVLWSSGPLVPCVFFVFFFLTCLFALFHYLF